jgi:hypothetical protein
MGRTFRATAACEVSDVSLEEAQAVLALLAVLRGPRSASAARSLAELVYRHTLEQACEVLIRWAKDADGVERSG